MLALNLAGGLLEYGWHGLGPEQAPTLVFLHEGLGTAALWRQFPQALAAQTGCGALCYSRYGYGGSAPCGLPRPLSYHEHEAWDILPQVLRRLGVERYFLIGHSDGATIALLHAARTPSPGLMGVVAEAPHLFVEDITITGIRAAVAEWQGGSLRQRLLRHHGSNVDCAFEGWSQAWLSPAFRSWDITATLGGITAPVLVIQGTEDEYATLDQVDAVARSVAGPVETLVLPECRHTPHRDQEATVLAAMRSFIEKHNRESGQ